VIHPSRTGSVVPRIIWSVLVLGLLAVAALAIVTRTERTPPLERLAEVPDFALVDQNGHGFTGTDLEGKVWVADFIFTRCRSTCPMLTERLGTLAGELDPRGDWAFLSVSVDPAYDTPPVLAAYAGEHAMDPDRWVLLTGDPDSVRTLITKGFFLSVEEGAGSAAEPILHSTRFVLLDRNREIRGYYEALDDEDLVRLRRDVGRLLDES